MGRGGGGGGGSGSGDYDDSCILCRVFFWFADLLIYLVVCLNRYVRSRKAAVRRKGGRKEYCSLDGGCLVETGWVRQVPVGRCTCSEGKLPGRVIN